MGTSDDKTTTPTRQPASLAGSLPQAHGNAPRRVEPELGKTIWRPEHRWTPCSAGRPLAAALAAALTAALVDLGVFFFSAEGVFLGGRK